VLIIIKIISFHRENGKTGITKLHGKTGITKLHGKTGITPVKNIKFNLC
jgi:hypothetical protein